MLTVITNTFARPDYVQFLASCLKATLQQPYRFIVMVQPNGLRRPWSDVHEVVGGTTSGYGAWRESLQLLDGPTVIIHDDCVPVLPWDSSVFPGEHCSRFNGSTLVYHATPLSQTLPIVAATRLVSPAACPASWPADVCEAAAASRVEHMLGGLFLHLDKGTISSPGGGDGEHKPRLIAAIAKMLGIEVPAPLTADELAAHPGRNFPSGVDGAGPGLGDMVAAGLSRIGITKPRVQAIASAVGIKDCGCSGRQAALNSVGRRLGIGGPAK